jgi:hypothetical protein
MLFMQDDLRVQRSSFTLCRSFDFTSTDPLLEELYRIQAVVAYAYGAPQPPRDGPFFQYEQASLIIFKPDLVSLFLVRPEHGMVAVSQVNPDLVIDQFQRVKGYYGLYNFRHHFWVAAGSRVYPPIPHLGLNISQDLAHDLHECFHTPHHHLLPQLFKEPGRQASDRVLTALAWYNRSNSANGDEHTAIVHLAIAFEALLGLPRDAKTERFTDTVSLLLGRVDRLSLWAAQFYAARSDVAHEGRTAKLHFSPPAKTPANGGALYGSLLGYGRQIFRLCVGTLLLGAELGEVTSLKDKLITNQERFEFIVRTLNDAGQTIPERFTTVSDTVLMAERFRFVGEAGLQIKTLTAAAQLAAKNLLVVDKDLDVGFRSAVEQLATAARSADCYDQMAAIQAVHDAKSEVQFSSETPVGLTRRLIEIVWYYTFMHYFQLREKRAQKEPKSPAAADPE